jgi:hypothetical protein
MCHSLTMVITKDKYLELMFVSSDNPTSTRFAELEPRASHDQYNYFLGVANATPNQLLEQALSVIPVQENAAIAFDDTVLDKRFASKISLAKKTFSGNTHSIVNGISVVTCVYILPDTGEYWVLNYRIHDPEADGKTKHQLVAEMIDELAQKVAFKYVLMDSGYCSKDLMKKIDLLGKIYYTVARVNRLVDDSETHDQPFQQIDALTWSNQDLDNGKTIVVKGLPGRLKLKLFYVKSMENKFEHIITNDLECRTSIQALTFSRARWKIEQLHRELKQLTGIEKCQCRSTIKQKNHIGLALQLWHKLKAESVKRNMNLYELKKSIFTLSYALALPLFNFLGSNYPIA